MLIGHFGVAAAVKAKIPEVSLWGLMLSTHLLDVVLVPLFITGVEIIVPVAYCGYGQAIIHSHHTHCLMSALVMAIIAGIEDWYLWGKRGAYVISSVIFSHWLLDALVHRTDMTIFPGTVGYFPLLGLGLWKLPVISIAFKLVLIIFGSILYHRSLVPKAKRKQRMYAYATSGLMAVLLG